MAKLVDLPMPVRHTARCREAQRCGHPDTDCVCTEGERYHEDWETGSDALMFASQKMSIGNWQRLREFLEEFHAEVACTLREERHIESGCPVCDA